MLSWFLNPWMLLGGVAVASPILIHLLNKRRFKIVEWAAMDFLFAADKKNRRRVQLENFILLALRCLAMLLIAFMLARPFLPSAMTNVLQQSKKLERVLVVDDSLSQRVPHGNSTAFGEAKNSIKELIAKFAASNKTEDWLTVLLTSDPENPILSNEPLTMDTLPALGDSIERLECTDRSADYALTLDSVSRYLSGKRESVGRAVYLFSDMRRKDWLQNGESETAPSKLLNSIGSVAEGCFVVDTANDNDQNLSIVSVRPTEFPISGKVIPFEVLVENHGTNDISQLRVSFQINDSQPDYEAIANLAPGQTQAIEFRYLFPSKPDELNDDDSGESQHENYRIRAEIDRQSLGDSNLKADKLIDDSESLYAARVLNGISVLLVDGAPSSVSERSETHYLRALDVPGSGLKTTTITANELETVALSKYRVIFLCNVDEVSPDRVESLKRWVGNGGGLVIMPGDRVRAQTFNDVFYQEGEGLSPVKLDSIKGDPTLSQWVNFEVAPQIHPALAVVLNSEATSVSKIDIFTWWTSLVDSKELGKTISVPLRLTDQTSSPGMVEKNLGKGRVVYFAFPADADWSMWPTGATFVPITLGLIDDFVGRSSENSVVQSGDRIRYPVDVSIFKNRVTLTNPQGEKIETVAAPVELSNDETDDSDAGQNVASSILYEAEFPAISNRGFYEIGLQRNLGGEDAVLFSANVDSGESDLKRMPPSVLDGDFFGLDVSMVSVEKLADQTVKGGSSEIWMVVLSILFTVLMVEQILGWFWGRKR
jgi:hypothetical protein